MGVIDDLLKRAQALSDSMDSGELVRDVLVDHARDIEEMQRLQLFEGKAASGDDIRPYYSEDLKPGGYFRSKEAAARYAEWKQSGISYPMRVQRNPDAPNLYVDGTFHSQIGAEFGTDAVGIVARTGYAQGIMDKYGVQTFGLTAENWSRIFTERGAADELLREMKKRLFG